MSARPIALVIVTRILLASSAVQADTTFLNNSATMEAAAGTQFPTTALIPYTSQPTYAGPLNLSGSNAAASASVVATFNQSTQSDQGVGVFRVSGDMQTFGQPFSQGTIVQVLSQDQANLTVRVTGKSAP